MASRPFPKPYSPAFPLGWNARAGQVTKNEEWPYAWLFPGVNSRQVHARGAVATPTNATVTAIVTYEVPTGFVFVLRGLMAGSNASNWVIGSGDLTFSLDVIVSGGSTRPVEFYGNQSITFPLGSTELPWPVLGRCEFESLEKLQLSCQFNANANGNFCYGAICGHLYPAAEHRRC